MLLAGILAQFRGFVCLLMGVRLDYVEVPLVDVLLRYSVVAIVVTAFAVGGVANSINIIDGFNGLADGVLIICFSMLGMISREVGDTQLVNLCILLALSVAGFMIVNFPFGKIFMGDGGAYLMGFMLAWTAVLLPMRNPKVSPWASILVCGYPVVETLFSMGRRTVLQTGAGNPDAAHLHSLIRGSVIERFFPQLPHYFRNAFVSPVCWTICTLFAAPALLWYDSTPKLILVLAGSMAFYVVMYYFVSVFKVAPCYNAASCRTQE